MDFLYFFTNYKQDHRLEITIKFDLLVCPTIEKIIDFSMHNVYWDTLYVTNALKWLNAGNIKPFLAAFDIRKY